MDITLESSWKQVLTTDINAPYFQTLAQRVRTAYLTKSVYPPPHSLFRALELCPFPKVKVVILGQDPYHGPGQAHGLAFSVPENTRIPPSLQNIYKEITSDLRVPMPASGNLERWAIQGVLLLNTTLTVEDGKAGSHQGWGWETFTDAIIQTLSHQREHVVFLLWGNHAKKKAALIDTSKHLVLTAPHPSPLSAHRGFLGCKHFSQANKYLQMHNRTPIDW